MNLRSDDRGQSVWLGFLMLLFVLILVLTMQQAKIVPDQNAEVEFQHAMEMEERLGTIRDRIYLAGDGGGTQSLTFDPSPEYRPRLLTINPPPPAGQLATRAEGNISLRVDGNRTNLSRACGYGDETILSRELAFDIDYNEYQKEPTIVYSNTALYERPNGTQLLLDEHQSLVQNDSITLRPLTSAYSEASTDPISIQFVAGPVGEMNVTATDSVSLTIPTQLPASKWETLLADQQNVRNVTQPTDDTVTIELDPQTYSVSCYGVGLGHAPPSGAR